MLTIDPEALSAARDALEAANAGRELERLACHKALYRAADEREDALLQAR